MGALSTHIGSRRDIYVVMTKQLHVCSLVNDTNDHYGIYEYMDAGVGKDIMMQDFVAFWFSALHI